MITVRFLGYMANLFGAHQSIDVRSIDELFKAMRVNYPDFALYLSEAAARGINYQIMVNGAHIPINGLNCMLPAGAIVSIVAMPSGAGGRGFRIIAGIALLGLGLAGVGFLGIKASTVAITGAALLFGALRGQQKAPKDDKTGQSNMFGGPVTTNQEGGRIPLIYGDHLAGWMIMSQKITSVYRAS